MNFKNITNIFSLFLFSVCWSLLFVLTVPILNLTTATTALFLQLFFAAIFLGLFFFRETIAFIKTCIFSNRNICKKPQNFLALMMPFLFAGSLFLQFSSRTAFAPPGSDVAFIYSLIPVLSILFGLIFKESYASLIKILLLLIALLGVIFITANWEYPSSFAPFTRFTAPEILLLISSASTALLINISKKLIKNISTTTLVTYVSWFGALFMLLVLIISGEYKLLVSINIDTLMMFSVFSIVLIVLPLFILFDLLKVYSVDKVSSAMLFVPIIVTSMIAIEKIFGFAILPTPFEWSPILTGSLIILLSFIALWIIDSKAATLFNNYFSSSLLINHTQLVEKSYCKKSIIKSLGTALSIAASFWLLIALFFPVERLQINGTLDSEVPFNVHLNIFGLNSANSLLLFMDGLLILLLALDNYKNRKSLFNGFWLLFSVFLILIGIISKNTLVINWFTNVPPEVQHAIGTPFATVNRKNILNIPQVTGIIFCFLSLFALIPEILYSKQNIRLRELLKTR